MAIKQGERTRRRYHCPVIKQVPRTVLDALSLR